MRNEIVMPSLAIICVFLLYNYTQINAQFIPVPPPSQSTGVVEGNVIENDRTPPVIEVITSELRQGKNVVLVKVTDESFIKYREIRYVHEGKIKKDNIVRDKNNIYKALVDVEPPSSIIVFDFVDLNGNKASLTKEFNVVPSSGNILDHILSWFRHIISYFQYDYRDTR